MLTANRKDLKDRRIAAAPAPTFHPPVLRAEGGTMRRFRVNIPAIAGVALFVMSTTALANDLEIYAYVMRVHNGTDDHIRVECNGKTSHEIKVHKYPIYKFKTWRDTLEVRCSAINDDGEEKGNLTVNLFRGEPRDTWNVQ